jgi:hypothetical protein
MSGTEHRRAYTSVHTAFFFYFENINVYTKGHRQTHGFFYFEKINVHTKTAWAMPIRPSAAVL